MPDAVVVLAALSGGVLGLWVPPRLRRLALRYPVPAGPTAIGLLGPAPSAHAGLAVALALVEGGLAARLGPVPSLPAFLVLGAVLVAVSALDLARGVIPRSVVWPGLAAGGTLLVVAAAVTGEWERLGLAAACAAGAFAVLAAVHLAAPSALGFGDVRLAGLAGAFLGWSGPATLVVALVAAWLVAGALAVPVALRRGWRGTLPIGPALAAGTLVGALWGPALVRWWLG